MTAGRAVSQNMYMLICGKDQETKMMPAGLVWDWFCEKENVAGSAWIRDLSTY